MTYPKEAKPCPICGKKAFLSRDIIPEADFGYSVGCPCFKIDDGIHGFTVDSPNEDGLTAFCFTTKEDAIREWNYFVDNGKWRIDRHSGWQAMNFREEA